MHHRAAVAGEQRDLLFVQMHCVHGDQVGRDEVQRAQLQLLRAQISFVFGRGSDGPPLLVDAARRLEALDPAVARETYLGALGAAMYAGRVDADSGVLEVAAAARAAPVAAQPPRSIDLVLDGLARRCTEGPGLRTSFKA